MVEEGAKQEKVSTCEVCSHLDGFKKRPMTHRDRGVLPKRLIIRIKTNIHSIHAYPISQP